MSQKRRAKGWWLICLLAGCAAPPLWATEAISRAVQVPPPQGWTQDTPLFHDESAVLVREEMPAPAPASPSAVRRGDAKAKPTKLSQALPSSRPSEVGATAMPQRKAGKTKIGQRTLAAQQKPSRADRKVGTLAKATAAHRPNQRAERAQGRAGHRAAQNTKLARASLGRASAKQPGGQVAAPTAKSKTRAKAPTMAAAQHQPVRSGQKAARVRAGAERVSRNSAAKVSGKRGEAGTSGGTRAAVKVASSSRRVHLDRTRAGGKRAQAGAVKKG